MNARLRMYKYSYSNLGAKYINTKWPKIFLHHSLINVFLLLDEFGHAEREFLSTRSFIVTSSTSLQNCTIFCLVAYAFILSTISVQVYRSPLCKINATSFNTSHVQYK